MLPKAGVFAHGQAKIVAQHIIDIVNGATPQSRFRGHGYCTLETGEGLAGFAFGDFFSEPSPYVEFRKPARTWHLGKMLFEHWWLSPPGLKKRLLQTMLSIGAKIFSILMSL
jgi:sulfide:quinone oxidoreductase